MAKTRYFQHLNSNDRFTFQKVTELDFIDDTGEMTMYYFKDGSKCNKDFIAPVNAENILNKEFAEVSSPSNAWVLKKVDPVAINDKPKAMKGKDGVMYEAPDFGDYIGSGNHAKTRIDVVYKPVTVSNYVAPNDSDYYIGAESFESNEVEQPRQFNFNSTIEDETPAPQLKQENGIKTVSTSNSNKSLPYVSESNGILQIDVRQILNSVSTVYLCFDDGSTCELPINEFIENAITPKEEKIVEKVVEKEVVVKTSDTDIDLGVNDVDKEMLNTMIDRSKKSEFEIDMDLTLSLPPTELYKMIKSAYPNDLHKGFVNIIANRMQVKELKSAVAEGLLAFYDDELEEDMAAPEEEVTPAPAKKTTRKKQ